MTKQAFIDKYKHELAGLVADAAVTARSGAPLAEWLRRSMQQIDAKLGSIYDELTTPAEVPANPNLRIKKP